MLSPSQRKGILEKEIEKYQAEGLEVIARTDTTAHLRRKVTMSKWVLLSGLLTLGVAYIAYMRWHTRRPREENILLEVTVDGEVITEHF